jgi:type IV secretory pathway VirB2 component (pilin)
MNSNLQENEFYFHKRIIKASKTSLCCCLTTKSVYRRRTMQLVEWRMFEYYIFLLIIVGTLTMVSKDYSGESVEWNNTLKKIEEFIGINFAIEAILKIISFGFVFGKNSYLRNGWNTLDFVIVFASIGSDHLRMIRMVRVLKPLRTLSRIPALKK